MSVLVRNKTTGTIVARRVKRTHARARFTRLIGLMGRRRVGPDEGLWFDRCGAIHTMFMRVPLDVIWLDRDLRVVEIAIDVHPWRAALVCPKAHSVLELGSGATRDLLVGDQLSFDAEPLVREPFTLTADDDADERLKLFAS